MESENISADNLMQIDQNEHQGASSSPSSFSRTPSSPSPPSKVVKKRQRYSYEFKQKVVAQLKTTSASALEKLYNVDRRIIGEWAKVETKINDTTHKRSTFKVFSDVKGWWPELENKLFDWFKQKRNEGACVSGKCLQSQAKVFYADIYRNSVNVKPFEASVGWLLNFLKRKKLVLRRISTTGRDLPVNIKALTLNFLSSNYEIFRKAHLLYFYKRTFILIVKSKFYIIIF